MCALQSDDVLSWRTTWIYASDYTEGLSLYVALNNLVNILTHAQFKQMDWQHSLTVKKYRYEEQCMSGLGAKTEISAAPWVHKAREEILQIEH